MLYKLAHCFKKIRNCTGGVFVTDQPISASDVLMSNGRYFLLDSRVAMFDGTVKNTQHTRSHRQPSNSMRNRVSPLYTCAGVACS